MFSVCQISFQLPPEIPADEAGIPGFDLLPEIGYENLRQTLFIIPAAEQRFMILPFFRRPGRLNGRRGGA